MGNKIVLALLGTALAPLAASAAAGYAVTALANPTETWVDNETAFCSATKAEIHGPGSTPTVKARTYSLSGDSCGYLKHKAPGNIKTRWVLEKLINGRWAQCTGSLGYHFNGVTDGVEAAISGFSRPPCGNGYYRTAANGGVKFDGNFRGNNITIRTNPPLMLNQ